MIRPDPGTAALAAARATVAMALTSLKYYEALYDAAPGATRQSILADAMLLLAELPHDAGYCALSAAFNHLQEESENAPRR